MTDYSIKGLARQSRPGEPDRHSVPEPAPRSRARTALRRLRNTGLLLFTAMVPLALTGCVAVGVPAPAASPSSSFGTVTVPLDIVQEQSATLAIVPVRIGGEGPYPFILDTGASTSGINAALASRLGLPRTGRSSTVSGVVSSSQVPLVRVSRWSVGGVALRPTTIGALSFGSSAPSSSAPSSGATRPASSIAGLLGSDQLSRFGAITLDYRHRQLRFTPQAAG